jgi:hypothetical protein
MDRFRQLVDVLDEKIVLGAGSGDLDRIAFLKCVVPIRVVGTCPERQTIGTESISASCSGVMELMTLGPEVTIMTPTFPVERA